MLYSSNIRKCFVFNSFFKRGLIRNALSNQFFTIFFLCYSAAFYADVKKNFCGHIFYISKLCRKI